jgi:hypothetical protein
MKKCFRCGAAWPIAALFFVVGLLFFAIPSKEGMQPPTSMLGPAIAKLKEQPLAPGSLSPFDPEEFSRMR